MGKNNRLLMIVGLTGGIGCGKSTVLSLFARTGWDTFDADGFCRSLYERNDPRIVAALSERWGAAVITDKGTIDRPAVANRVFGDPGELAWLNNLFHPLVRNELSVVAGRKETEKRYLLCDVPLLYETGWEKDFQTVIAVWTSTALQRERLLQRGWSDQEIKRRCRCQVDMDCKLSRADYGIINCGDMNVLELQCTELDKIIKEKSWPK